MQFIDHVACGHELQAPEEDHFDVKVAGCWIFNVQRRVESRKEVVLCETFRKDQARLCLPMVPVFSSLVS
jgi:hypothetical protein